MRIRRLLSQLVDSYGPYIPFVGSSPPAAESASNLTNPEPPSESTSSTVSEVSSEDTASLSLTDRSNSVEPALRSKSVKNGSMKHRKGQVSGSPPKGKGKGKSMGSTSGDTVDLRDLPITLPEFANGDHHTKIMPRYHAVLRRSENDGVGMEDIDTLQLEIEALLSSTVVRKNSLQEEVKVIQHAEKYKGQGKYLKRVSCLWNLN